MQLKTKDITRAICSGFVPLTTKVSTVGGSSRNLSLNGNRATSIFSAALAFAAIHSSASAVQLVDAISASRLVLYRMGFPAKTGKAVHLIKPRPEDATILAFDQLFHKLRNPILAS